MTVNYGDRHINMGIRIGETAHKLGLGCIEAFDPPKALKTPELRLRKDPHYHDIQGPHDQPPKVEIELHNEMAIKAAREIIKQLQDFISEHEQGEIDE